MNKPNTNPPAGDRERFTLDEIKAALEQELRPLQEEAKREGWSFTWEIVPGKASAE